MYVIRRGSWEQSYWKTTWIRCGENMRSEHCFALNSVCNYMMLWCSILWPSVPGNIGWNIDNLYCPCCLVLGWWGSTGLHESPLVMDRVLVCTTKISAVSHDNCLTPEQRIFWYQCISKLSVTSLTLGILYDQICKNINGDQEKCVQKRLKDRRLLIFLNQRS